MGHFAELLRLTASPFCRLQVHLPLPLSCARLPGLLRAPRPGLGPRIGKGHERGELGVRGVWAGRGPGLSPGAVHNEHPNYRLPGIREASSACGFVRSLPHAKTTARKPVAAKARPGKVHAHFSHPASGPGATSVRMRTRPAASPGDVGPERRSRVEMPQR